MDFASVEYYLSVMMLVTSVLGMGATLTVREFGNVFRAPQGILSVLFAQIVMIILFYVGVSLGIGIYEVCLKRLKWGVLYAER